MLDTRTPAAFGGAHIKDSYHVWLRGIPMFAGWVLPYAKAILLVLEDRDHLDIAVRYLIRLGYDRVEGYLCSGVEACGLEAWYTEALPAEHLGLLTVQELQARIDRRDELVVLDVRSEEEWAEGHIEAALHIYVGHLNERVHEVPIEHPIAVICSVGNRSSLGASILQQAGCREVYTVLGGMIAWQNAGYSITS